MKGKFHTTEGKIGMLPETGSGPFKENFQGLRNRSKEGSETRTQSPPLPVCRISLLIPETRTLDPNPRLADSTAIGGLFSF